MNQKETLELWAKGTDAWNDWANEMLAKRNVLEEKGKWWIENNNEPVNDETKQWLKEASAIFSSKDSPSSFPTYTSFSDWIFPSDSHWTGATFEGGCNFENTTFLGDAVFFCSTFCDDTIFRNATFSADVYFISVTFWGDTWFLNANFPGTVQFDKTAFLGGSSAVAWFDGATFLGSASFNEVIFEVEAWFKDVTFTQGLTFQSVTFAETAVFRGSTFSVNADFREAVFSGGTDFSEATFSGNTDFSEVTFEDLAWFNSVCFEKPSRFSDARFNTNASFNSAQIKQAFDLSGARFKEVPDFRQTHCEEAPLLDDVHIDSTIIKQRKSSHDPDFTVTANYRALKRLAIQGHDHKHEVEFFAEELRSKRLMVDKRWHWDWILSGVFQITSDYGRSILRPLLFWLLIVGLSATSYLLTATQPTGNVALQCVKGEGWQWVSAIQLAIGKGLLFPGIVDRTLMMQAYDCLYGDTIPTLTSAALGLQTLLSSALLFLILLGIRNRFKLK